MIQQHRGGAGREGGSEGRREGKEGERKGGRVERERKREGGCEGGGEREGKTHRRRLTPTHHAVTEANKLAAYHLRIACVTGGLATEVTDCENAPGG